MGCWHYEDLVLQGGDGRAFSRQLGLDCPTKNEEIRIYRLQTQSASQELYTKNITSPKLKQQKDKIQIKS